MKTVYLSTLRLAVSLVLTLVITGCSQLGIEKPNVSLTNISLGESNSFLGTSVIIDLKITNPNGIALPLSAMSYSLSFNDAKLLSGVTNDLKSIAAYGSQDVSLTLDANVLALPKLLVALNKSRDVNYAFDATLSMKGLIPDISLTQTGKLSDINP